MKFLLGGGGILAAALVALLVLPSLLVERIEARVHAEIERATRVDVSWRDAGLTFFRDFPHPTLTLSGLDVVGTGTFSGDTLASIADFRLVLNGPSALRAARGRGPLVIRSVRLDHPRLLLRVDEEGIANWDVLTDGPDSQPSESSAPEGSTSEGSATRGVAVSLESFEISGADIVVDNAHSGLFVQASGLEHSLRGDFSRASLVAETRTVADALTVRFAGVPYLSQVAVGAEANFDVNVAERSVRLTENALRLNELLVEIEGTATQLDDGLSLDLSFRAPSRTFAEILSLVPTVYSEEFASLETGGSFALDGRVQGSYGPDQLPAFALDLSIEDGHFRYPGVRVPTREIRADLSIHNPGGDMDSTVVELSRFHVEIDGQPLDAAITVRTPLSDPDADVRVEGTVDLNDAARALNMADADGWRGVVEADATMRARRSDVDEGRYERIAARGTVVARDVAVRNEALRQPVEVRNARIVLTPQTAQLSDFDAQLGSSDLRATGQLDNVLGFAIGGQPLRGTGSFTSPRFDLDEWKSDDAVASIVVPSIFDLTLDARFDQLVFNGIEATNAAGRAIVRDGRLTLEGFGLQALGGRVRLDGFYETVDPDRPTFGMALALDSLDIAASSEALLTVRSLAPVARYARGTFSTDLTLDGVLGAGLAPVLESLDGEGSLTTSRVAIEGFPILDRLAETLQLPRFSNPTVDALRSSIHIEGGRLRVDPFQVGIAGMPVTVSGSNGIDQSVDYSLGLDVPRSGLAGDALDRLSASAASLGVDLGSSGPIRVSTRVTGTVTQPALDLGLGQAAGSVGSAATASATAAVQGRVDDARDRMTASQEEARQRAQAQADSIVAEAERQAETIRQQGQAAAAEVRAQGARAAEELLARATNALARAAAQPAADRLRSEAEARAATIEREADERATALVTEARARADALVRG